MDTLAMVRQRQAEWREAQNGLENTSLRSDTSDRKDFSEPRQRGDESVKSVSPPPASPACQHPAGPDPAQDPVPTPALLAATLPEPAPCGCDGSVWWLDPQGRLHCRRCQAPPHPSLVRGLARVRLDRDGSFCWAHLLQAIPPDPGPLTFQPADEPACPTCGGLWFWWNFLDQKFCQQCHEKNFKGIFRRLDQAARLRDHYGRDPETARLRAANEVRLARLADERIKTEAARNLVDSPD